MGLGHTTRPDIGILDRLWPVHQGTVGFGQVIHDLVVEKVAGSDLGGIIVQTSRVGEHSVPRHLSIRKRGQRPQTSKVEGEIELKEKARTMAEVSKISELVLIAGANFYKASAGIESELTPETDRNQEVAKHARRKIESLRH